MLYQCQLCSFHTDLLYNYNRHCTTRRHLDKITEPIKKRFICEYCEQEFSFKQSMYKHIKYTCTKNKDEDVKELVRLMNLQMEQKERELMIHKEQIESQNKQIEGQRKQIEKLMCKLEINGSFNTTINNNIQLLAYKESDFSHLTEKDYKNCIKQVNFCVKQLIEKIHFNPDKPENMNIYISNLKDKYMMVYEAGAWNIKNKDVLESIYNDKELMLEEWLDEEQHKYPELKEKFLRYLNNKENDDTLNMIKDEIKIMMYNKAKHIKTIVAS